ncbi:hypothetical protein, partial [Drancourtella sp. An12]|uniref:hypothetical protein n=1 Tax=Drancourtella sp. An12 TaxID=1965548 RepID=UPI001121BC62
MEDERPAFGDCRDSYRYKEKRETPFLKSDFGKREFSLFCFIGNCVSGAAQKERMFIERMLDKHAFGYDDKALARSEDIETF